MIKRNNGNRDILEGKRLENNIAGERVSEKLKHYICTGAWKCIV